MAGAKGGERTALAGTSENVIAQQGQKQGGQIQGRHNSEMHLESAERSSRSKNREKERGRRSGEGR
eukprot:1444196-Pleurochrysis_carterae.AAC.3